MQVERAMREWQHFLKASGERVSNAWVICLEDWNNSLKEELIPNVLFSLHDFNSKGSRKASALR